MRLYRSTAPPRRREPGVALPLIVTLLVLSACRPDPSMRAVPTDSPVSSVGEAPMAESNLDPRRSPETADLRRLCEEIPEGFHPQLGRGPMHQLALELENLPLETDALELRVARGEALAQLADAERAMGELDQAITHYGEALDSIEGMSELPAATREAIAVQISYARALAHLRAAENANCLQGGNGFTCLLGRGPGGVFEETTQLRAAIDALERSIAASPDDLPARWLLNVAHAAAGDPVDALPAAQRIAAAFEAPAESGIRFRDIGRALGVASISLLGGAVMEDFDGDGRLDLLASNYDPCEGARIFLNDGAGGFVERFDAGLLDQGGGFNALQADYDNDGDNDLLLLRGAWQKDQGRQRNSLLRNDGTGRFEDVTLQAGLAEPALPTQAGAWADFDLDGDLDLYVGNETSDSEVPLPAQLFANQGDGRFVDVAPRLGVTNDRLAKGVAWGDYDDDGDPDLYVSNLGPNRLYRNDGASGFVDVAAEAGVEAPLGRSFATWFWDYDNDGRLDLFVAGYRAETRDVVADLLGQPTGGERPRLYRNAGSGRFEDVTARVGLDRVWLPMGANFGDVDSDGWPDIYLGTGAPAFDALLPNVLLRNRAGEAFEDITAAAGVGHLQKGHGVAFGDVDGDGDQDLFVQTGGFVPGDRGPDALFLNQSDSDASGRFLTLRLVGQDANRSAIGARILVEVETAAGPRRIHALAGSGGSFGASSLQQEIGLGDASAIRRLEIRWPSGGGAEPQVFENLAPDQVLEIVEGDAAYRTIDLPPIALRGSG